MREFKLHEHTIFVTLSGSQAHGTARQGSDVDLRGVCIAPLWMRVSLLHRFEQLEGELPHEIWSLIEPRLATHPTAAHGMQQKVESTVFDIAKFFELCCAANPNALEILFADERDWQYVTTIWRKLHAERQRFLSLKVRETYLGYALSQLKRIKTHRAWLLSPPTRKPARSDFGLPEQGTLSRDDLHRIEQAVAEKLRSWDVAELEMPRATRIALKERLETLWSELLATPNVTEDDQERAAAMSLGLSQTIISTIENERKYRAAQKHWESFQTWKDERNPARAKLEAQFGYDTKHGMHLIRLMRSGLEVLETGTLHVRRADAEELNAIRDGALSYEQLIAHAEELRERMLNTSPHPSVAKDVDREELDELMFDLIRQAERETPHTAQLPL